MMDMKSLEIVQTQWAKLPEDDQAFALSLVSQFKRRKALSVRQWPWVTKLAAAITGDVTPEVSKAANVICNGVQIGTMDVVLDMFALAATKLKYPVIVLALPDKTPVKLWISGPKSSHPGALAMNVGVHKRWAGWIMQDGVWTPPKSLDTLTATALAALMTRFVDAPADVSAECGKLLGKCCYCNSELSADNSLDVGYGPICAKRWGLPWGSMK